MYVVDYDDAAAKLWCTYEQEAGAASLPGSFGGSAQSALNDEHALQSEMMKSAMHAMGMTDAETLC